jgi:hypothetical protein
MSTPTFGTPQRQLSHEAISSFKQLYLKHFSTHLPDDEAEETALRLLRFFDMLLRGRDDARAAVPVSGCEAAAMALIEARAGQGSFPTVREIASAAGVRSSRTGARILRSLINKGHIVQTGRRRYQLAHLGGR